MNETKNQKYIKIDHVVLLKSLCFVHMDHVVMNPIVICTDMDHVVIVQVLFNGNDSKDLHLLDMLFDDIYWTFIGHLLGKYWMLMCNEK